MRKRNRYRQMEELMTKILIGDLLVFIIFLICCGKGWSVAKVVMASVSIIVSLLSMAWLFITGELIRRRSLWMSTGFGAIFVCLLVSLILKYPCPPIM